MPMILPNNNITRVYPSSITVIKFETGATIDKIKLDLVGGLVIADIGKLTLKADGNIIWVDTAKSNLLRAAYHNVTLPTNQIVLDFTERDARGGGVEQYLSSIPSNFIENLTLEIEILSTAPTTGTPNIVAHNILRAPTTNKWINKFQLHTFFANNIGNNHVFIPTGYIGGILKRIYFEEANTNQILGIEILNNQRRLQVANRSQIESEEMAYGKIPQPKLLVQDFVVDGNMSNSINTGVNKDGEIPVVEFIINCASTGLINAYFNYIDPIRR
jgi:hypothetical protein